MAHKSRRDGRRMGCGIGSRPSLRDSRAFGVEPSVETLGYSRLSLRDSQAAVLRYTQNGPGVEQSDLWGPIPYSVSFSWNGILLNDSLIRTSPPRLFQLPGAVLGCSKNAVIIQGRVA